MKDFIAKVGGRRFYSDDLINVQDSINALVEVLSEYGDCILSGCEVSGSEGSYAVSPGYVRIGGKLRKFEGGSFNTFPFYIVPDNAIVQTVYKDNVSRDAIGVYTSHLSTESVGGALVIADKEDKRHDAQFIKDVVTVVRKYAGPSHFYVANALNYNKTTKKFSTSEIEDAKEGDLCNYLTKVYKCTSPGLGENAVWEFAYDYHTGAVGVCMGGDYRTNVYGPWEMTFEVDKTELTYEEQTVNVTLSASRTVSVYDGYTGDFISQSVQEGAPILSVDKYGTLNDKVITFPANNTEESRTAKVTAIIGNIERSVMITQTAQYQKYVFIINGWEFDDGPAGGGLVRVDDSHHLSYKVQKYNLGVLEGDVTEFAKVEYGVQEIYMADIEFVPYDEPNQAHVRGFKDLGKTDTIRNIACTLYLTVSITEESTGKTYSQTITRNVYQEENSLRVRPTYVYRKITIDGKVFEIGFDYNSYQSGLYGTILIPSTGGTVSVEAKWRQSTDWYWDSGAYEKTVYNDARLEIGAKTQSGASQQLSATLQTGAIFSVDSNHWCTITGVLEFPANSTGENVQMHPFIGGSFIIPNDSRGSKLYVSKELVEG